MTENLACEQCGSTNTVQKHHISYDPPKIIRLCIKCHFDVHRRKHGVFLPFRRRRVCYTIGYGFTQKSFDNLKSIQNYFKKKEGIVLGNTQVFDIALQELKKKLASKKEE